MQFSLSKETKENLIKKERNVEFLYKSKMEEKCQENDSE